MLVKTEKKKPDIGIIQNRYFSVNELRNALRTLDIGMDNAEFKRLWDEEIVCPPDVLEPNYVGWKYNSALELIQQVYALRNKLDEFEHTQIDAVLMIQKEGIRYRTQQNTDFLRLLRKKRKETRGEPC